MSRMAIRKIAQIGHPVLRQTARHLTREEFASPETQQFIDDLVETMHDADGAGLAATQAYEPIAICAIEVRNNPRYPYKPNIPLTILVNLGGRTMTPRSIELEDPADAREPFARDHILGGDRGLPHLGSAMRLIKSTG